MLEFLKFKCYVMLDETFKSQTKNTHYLFYKQCLPGKSSRLFLADLSAFPISSPLHYVAQGWKIFLVLVMIRSLEGGSWSFTTPFPWSIWFSSLVHTFLRTEVCPLLIVQYIEKYISPFEPFLTKLEN